MKGLNSPEKYEDPETLTRVPDLEIGKHKCLKSEAEFFFLHLLFFFPFLVYSYVSIKIEYALQIP